MTVLKIVLYLLGMIDRGMKWFRDQSIHDAGRKAERAEVEKAERKAQDVVENVKPVTRDNLAERLRDGGF